MATGSTNYKNINVAVTPYNKLPIWFSDVNGMFLNKSKSWAVEPNHGKGDALARTAVATIAYFSEDFLQSVIKCFVPVYEGNKELGTNNYHHLKAFRYPLEKKGEDWHWDTSRDQVVMALVALRFANANEDFDRIAGGLLNRLSIKYKLTHGVKLWIHSVYKKYPIRYFLFLGTGIIFYNLWNKSIRAIASIKSAKSIPDYLIEKNNKYDHSKLKGYKKYLSKLLFPAYAHELKAWQIFVMKKSFMKRLLQKMMLWDTEKHNLLIRALCKDKSLTKDEVSNYLPLNTYPWNTRFDITNDRDIGYNPNKEDIIALDRDILQRIYRYNYE